MTKVDFTDIDKNLPDGQNMGGLPQIVYFASYADVVKWPVRPKSGADGMTLQKMGELDGNLMLSPDKKFNRLYLTDDEGKLDFEGVGEKDGKSFVIKLRVYHPGLNSKLLGFINLVKNESLVFIVPDSNGNLFLLGDEKRPATMDSVDGMTTGQKTEERPGAGLVFTYKTASLYRYTGTIQLTAAPTTIMACCPDAIDDHFTIAAPSAASVGALFPTGEGWKRVYTADLVPGGAIFSIGRSGLNQLGVIYTGDMIMATLVYGNKSYILSQNAVVDNTGKRVNLTLSLTKTGENLEVKVFVNGVEEPVEMNAAPEENNFVPTKDYCYLFRCPTTNLDAGDMYGGGTLMSLAIEGIENGVSTKHILWDFTGETAAERLKNKAAGGAGYNLEAKNIADINNTVKEIPIPK